jgi:hypothetical protein
MQEEEKTKMDPLYVSKKMFCTFSCLISSLSLLILFFCSPKTWNEFDNPEQESTPQEFAFNKSIKKLLEQA